MHNPVNHQHTNYGKYDQLQMVCPTIRILFFCLYHFFSDIFFKSLTGLNGSLVSTWSSFHLFASNYWRHNSLRLFWFFLWIYGLCDQDFLLNWSWYFCWFFSALFYRLFFNLFCRFLGHFNLSFLDWNWSLFLFRWCSIFCIWIWNRMFLFCMFSLLDRWFLFSYIRISLNNWWFSFTNRWFHASFTLETFHDFLKSKSGFLKIHLKLKSVLFWDLHFLFESVFAVSLKLIDEYSWVNIDTSKLIFLIGIFFSKLKGEKYFSVFIEVREIEVELTTSERHDMSTVCIDKISVGSYFVFVKLLHS